MTTNVPLTQGANGATAAPEREDQAPVDIYETAKAFHVRADLPGVRAGDLGVSVEKGILTITGAVHEPAYDGYTAASREHHARTFKRAFQLPDDIDQGSIDAVLKDGVLQVTLPKAPDTQPRKIQVRAG